MITFQLNSARLFENSGNEVKFWKLNGNASKYKLDVRNIKKGKYVLHLESQQGQIEKLQIEIE